MEKNKKLDLVSKVTNLDCIYCTVGKIHQTALVCKLITVSPDCEDCIYFVSSRDEKRLRSIAYDRQCLKPRRTKKNARCVCKNAGQNKI